MWDAVRDRMWGVTQTLLRRPELDGTVAELRCPLLTLVLQRRRRLLHRLEAGVVRVVGAGLGHHLEWREEERGEEEEAWAARRPLPLCPRRVPSTRPSFCAFAQSNAFRKCSSSSDRSGKPSPLVSIDASPGAASATAATCGATLSTAAARFSKPSRALMNSLSRALPMFS